jgi:predicted ABC-type ATPase
VDDEPQSYDSRRGSTARFIGPLKLSGTFMKIVIIAGLTYARKIDAWRSAGYDVKLFFLSLASPEEAVARVAMRVQQGGHSIPEETIRRRFDSGLRNFQNVYRHRVSFWQWFDNSDRPPILLSEGTNP